MRLSDPCSIKYLAAHSSGWRPLRNIRLVVMHVAEAATALEVARYFASEESTGSAHLAVGQWACYRCLPSDVIPWGAPGANADGFHIEQAGFVGWTRAEWLAREKTIRRSAYKAQHHCAKFGLPTTFLDAHDLARGERGITTHHEVNRWQLAIGAPGDHSHTDPGPTWPQDVFMHWVAKYAAA